MVRLIPLNFHCIPQTPGIPSPLRFTQSSFLTALHSAHTQDPVSLRLLTCDAQDPRKVLQRANHHSASRLWNLLGRRVCRRGSSWGARAGVPGPSCGPGAQGGVAARRAGRGGRLSSPERELAGRQRWPRPGPRLAGRRGRGRAERTRRGRAREVGRGGGQKLAGQPPGRPLPEHKRPTHRAGATGQVHELARGYAPRNSSFQLGHGRRESRPVPLKVPTQQLQSEATSGHEGETPVKLALLPQEE